MLCRIVSNSPVTFRGVGLDMAAEVCNGHKTLRPDIEARLL